MAKEFKLGQQVKYVRIKPNESASAAELVHGEGVIVGHIIGVSKRENYMVKDGEKAYNLEPFAIDPTPEEAENYLHHHRLIQGLVEDHNKHVSDEVARINELIDGANAEMFGPQVL